MYVYIYKHTHSHMHIYSLAHNVSAYCVLLCCFVNNLVEFMCGMYMGSILQQRCTALYPVPI